jgi:hypothetical protein
MLTQHHINILFILKPLLTNSEKQPKNYSIKITKLLFLILFTFKNINKIQMVIPINQNIVSKTFGKVKLYVTNQTIRLSIAVFIC